MITEEYLGRSRLFRRLKSGPHSQLVELYAERLVRDELGRQGTWRYLSVIGGLLGWLARSRSKLRDLNEPMVERYLRHRAGKPRASRGSGRPAGRNGKEAWQWLTGWDSRRRGRSSPRC